MRAQEAQEGGDYAGGELDHYLTGSFAEKSVERSYEAVAACHASVEVRAWSRFSIYHRMLRHFTRGKALDSRSPRRRALRSSSTRSEDRGRRRSDFALSLLSRTPCRGSPGARSRSAATLILCTRRADASADQLMQRSTVGWAVCGRADFVKGVVPAMRTAGISVRALSVVPANFHNVTCRLRAQDAQDVLCRTLNIPEGVSVEGAEGSRGL